MIEPKIPENEVNRIQELESFSILDTLPEEDYDNLTSLASQICGTDISLISLIDEERQWFKSRYGLETSEAPRKFAFCAHAINNPSEIMIVNDARLDERFKDNPLVTNKPHVIFYAGVPLVTDTGTPLGTLCVIHNKPKELTESQLDSLKTLSKQVLNLLELRKNKLLLERALQKEAVRNKELEQFAYIAAHDIKSPLSNISSVVQLFHKTYGEDMDPSGKSLLNLLDGSVSKLISLVDGLLKYSHSRKEWKEDKEVVAMDSLKKGIQELFHSNQQFNLNFCTDLHEVYTNRCGLEQILLNLITNAIKYNDKEETTVDVGAFQLNGHYHFYVKDNGPGIPKESHEDIFKIFTVLNEKDKFGKTGNGIGLAIVKQMVEAQGGVVSVESNENVGCKFLFSIPY